MVQVGRGGGQIATDEKVGRLRKEERDLVDRLKNILLHGGGTSGRRRVGHRSRRWRKCGAFARRLRDGVRL